MPSLCTIHPHTSKLTARVCLLRQRAEAPRSRVPKATVRQGRGVYLQRRWDPPLPRRLRRVTLLVFFDAVKR